MSDTASPSAGRVKLAPDQAIAFGAAALGRVGYSAEQARTIATVLVDAELCGYPALGLARILTIDEHPRNRNPRTPLSVVYETPVSALIDGGNNVGFYAVHRATEIAIEKARGGHFALVGVHNCWLSGRNAYYLEMIARAGFAGIHLACGRPVVAPPGGRAPAFGTNPIAFGLPGEPHPYIFDMATSALNHGDVVLAGRLKEQLPEGSAIDAQGLPTRDPMAALGGAILPFGGHKGYGLSLTIQAFGLMAGAALPAGQVQDFAFLFVVFDPALLMPPAQYKKQLAELLQRVAATPLQPGASSIRIPSQRAFEERERRRASGIELDARIHERILAIRAPAA
ncbi:MAG TPA: Ldh family oxidoreductase [Burkholderiales bacterium]|jgi:LDH2 family malate/lactate/ureidoglycolate dehydrogenase